MVKLWSKDTGGCRLIVILKTVKQLVRMISRSKLSPVKIAAKRAIESRFSRHLLEISATFYKQLFCQYSFTKNPLQTEIREMLHKTH